MTPGFAAGMVVLGLQLVIAVASVVGVAAGTLAYRKRWPGLWLVAWTVLMAPWILGAVWIGSDFWAVILGQQGLPARFGSLLALVALVVLLTLQHRSRQRNGR